MKLVDVYANRNASNLTYQWLFTLLSERKSNESISHVRMPSWEKHIAFVESRPYKGWYFIYDKWCVGACYITKVNEIGIQIFKGDRRKGYASKALAMLRKKHKGKLYANINPKNRASIAFFKKHGFTPLQVTYVSA